jgi:hypothetical protein
MDAAKAQVVALLTTGLDSKFAAQKAIASSESMHAVSHVPQETGQDIARNPA